MLDIRALWASRGPDSKSSLRPTWRLFNRIIVFGLLTSQYESKGKVINPLESIRAGALAYARQLINASIGEMAHVARYANPTTPYSVESGFDVQYLGATSATFIFMNHGLTTAVGRDSLVED